MKNLFLFFVVLSSVSVNAQSGREPQLLSDILLSKVGPDAENCGEFRVNFNQSERKEESAKKEFFAKAKPCLLKAFSEKKAFRVAIYFKGIDSQIAKGIFSKPDGSMFVYWYDSDPSGGSRAGARFITDPCD